jgi:hypothetical protein
VAGVVGALTVVRRLVRAALAARRDANCIIEGRE